MVIILVFTYIFKVNIGLFIGCNIIEANNTAITKESFLALNNILNSTNFVLNKAENNYEDIAVINDNSELPVNYMVKYHEIMKEKYIRFDYSFNDSDSVRGGYKLENKSEGVKLYYYGYPYDSQKNNSCSLCKCRKVECLKYSCSCLKSGNKCNNLCTCMNCKNKENNIFKINS